MTELSVVCYLLCFTEPQIKLTDRIEALVLNFIPEKENELDK